MIAIEITKQVRLNNFVYPIYGLSFLHQRYQKFHTTVYYICN